MGDPFFMSSGGQFRMSFDNVFAWTAKHGAAGISKDSLYLVRPDTYVALADASGAGERIAGYFERRGLAWSAPQPVASERTS